MAFLFNRYFNQTAIAVIEKFAFPNFFYNLVQLGDSLLLFPGLPYCMNAGIFCVKAWKTIMIDTSWGEINQAGIYIQGGLVWAGIRTI